MSALFYTDLKNLEHVSDPAAWNAFFVKYGPGNSLPVKDQTYMRYVGYLTILNDIRKFSQSTFEIAHKGTPYYLLAWIQGDMANFSKAMMFLALAVEEDMKIHVTDYVKDPAYQLLTLQKRYGSADRLYQKLSKAVESLLDQFESNTELKFAVNSQESWLLIVDKLRSISNEKWLNIASMLAYWITQYQEYAMLAQLCIRGGTSANLLQSHLRDGSLIFESLCKILYPTMTDIGSLYNDQLRSLVSPSTKEDFFLSTRDVKSMSEITTFVNAHGTESGMVISFWVTYAIRNFTGHGITDNLSYDDYCKFFNFISSAIFRIIYDIVQLS